MVRELIEWWAGLSPWLRFGVAGGLLLVSTILFLTGFSFRVSIWGWAIGFALLLFSFPSSAEKKGYHDF